MFTAPVCQGAPPGHMQQPDGQQYGMPQSQQPHYAQHPQQQQLMPPAQQTGPVQSNLDEEALAQQGVHHSCHATF